MPPTLCPSVVEAIGNTPLVELSRLVRRHGLRGRILAKLEYFNPGASKKDRNARQMIEDAERDGRLKPGQTVVELTSGNAGTGLAIVCAVKGYPFVAVISKGNSVERSWMMRALGAEVVLVDQAPGSPRGQVSGPDLALVEQRTQQIVKERNAFRAHQFELVSNLTAHERGTAREAWEQSDGSITAFADFVGAGGSFFGCAKFFKKLNRGIRCHLIEPATAPYLAGGKMTNPNHKIQGGGYSRELPLADRSLIDEFLTVTNEQAIETARELARAEAIFGGFSGGANTFAALELLREREKGETILVLICDSGLKYMSTDLYPNPAA